MPILAILVALRVLPVWAPEVITLIIKYGPAAYAVAKFLIKMIGDLEAKHPVTFITLNNVNNVPTTIPGYAADGNITMIPNPDLHAPNSSHD